MCGIAALHAYHPAAPAIDRNELALISAQQSRRGPDGEGIWFDAQGRVGLAHRRLSIIDPDARAAQPMCSTDGRAMISFNGEIYNFRSLRDELQRDGCVFRTQSDTEVLIELYCRQGERLFPKLRGMYALAIWDLRRGALLIARDPYGIKPLYYADDGWTLRVASQVQALRASPRVSRLPEPAGRVGFALFGSVPEPYTMWQEIRALPAGHLTWADESGLHLPRVHWLVGDAYRDVSKDTNDEASVLDALRQSVKAHLVADVPVGVFLSAGVDSSALLGTAGVTVATAMPAITIGFKEFEGRAEDEVPLAALIADRYAARHIVRHVDRAEFDEDLPSILVAMDQPSIDGFNTWFAAKAAREHSLKVMLSGIGGDELFGGYHSFVDVPRWRRWFAATTKVSPVGRMLRYLLAPILPRLGLPDKTAGLPELGGTWAGAYLLRRGTFLPWELPRLFSADEVEAGLYRLCWPATIECALRPPLPDAFSHVAVMEATQYLRNQLLRDADWASMAHGVEVRTPLVDAQLLEVVARSRSVRSPGKGKQLLARLPSEPLPSVVRDRPKTGFSTPMASWVQQSPALQSWRRHKFLQASGTQASRRLVAAMLTS